MAYQENKPAASDRLKDSQTDIQGNFQALKTLIDVNHGTFGALDEGKHKWVTLPDQGSAPNTSADEIAVFSQLSSLTNQSEFSYRRESNGDTIECAGLGSSNGWVRLPSGLLIKWASDTVTTNGTVNRTWPTAATIPAFSTLPFHYQLTLSRNTNTVLTTRVYIDSFSGTFSPTQYSLFVADVNATTGYRLLAIGT